MHTCNPLGTGAASHTHRLAHLERDVEKDEAHFALEKEKYTQAEHIAIPLLPVVCGTYFQDYFIMMLPQNSKNGSQIFYGFFCFQREKFCTAGPDSL